MSIRVMKFGGTSVGSIERIQNVARIALDARAKGDQVCLVISAMSGETNRLVGLACQVNPIPFSREYDLLVASGEQIAIGLVTLAVNTEARLRKLISDEQSLARPLLAHQLGFITDSTFSKARIHAIRPEILTQDLTEGVIPVIAGFQGVDAAGNITTLGRGGSDTSAVAIAAALQADVCDIFTDVDGVYTTDPRLCAKARKIDRICYEEMMELASLGSKVLHVRAVELAAKFQVPVHVRSSFTNKEGTWVMPLEKIGATMEEVVVAGIATDQFQTKFTLQALPASGDAQDQLFQTLANAAIVVDIIVQDFDEFGKQTISFTVGEADRLKTESVLKQLTASRFPEALTRQVSQLAKISIVGVGMQNHPGVASRMFHALANSNIKILLTTTSEIKVSCLIPMENLPNAVGALHKTFDLDAQS